METVSLIFQMETVLVEKSSQFYKTLDVNNIIMLGSQLFIVLLLFFFHDWIFNEVFFTDDKCLLLITEQRRKKTFFFIAFCLFVQKLSSLRKCHHSILILLKHKKPFFIKPIFLRNHKKFLSFHFHLSEGEPKISTSFSCSS